MLCMAGLDCCLDPSPFPSSVASGTRAQCRLNLELRLGLKHMPMSYFRAVMWLVEGRGRRRKYAVACTHDPQVATHPSSSGSRQGPGAVEHGDQLEDQSTSIRKGTRSVVSLRQVTTVFL